MMNVNELRIPKTLHFADEISQLNNNNFSNSIIENTDLVSSSNSKTQMNKSRAVNKFIKSNSKFIHEYNDDDLTKKKKNGNYKTINGIGNGKRNENINNNSISNGNGNRSHGSIIYDILDLYMLPESAEQQQKEKSLSITNKKINKSSDILNKSKNPTTNKNKNKNDDSKSVLLASLHQGYHQYFDNDDQITNSTTRTNKSTLTNRTSPEISTNGGAKSEKSTVRVTIDIDSMNNNENEEVIVGGSSGCDIIGTIVDEYENTTIDEDEEEEELETKNHGFWWRTTTMVHKLKTFRHRSISTTSNGDNIASTTSGYIDISTRINKRRESVDEKLKSIFSDGTIEEKNLRDGFNGNEQQRDQKPLPKRRVTIQDQAEIIYPNSSELNYYHNHNQQLHHHHHHQNRGRRHHYHHPLPSSHFQRKVSRKFSLFKKGF